MRRLTKEQMNALEWAIWLTKLGIACFPCNENKSPACPRGFNDATKDEFALRNLWHMYPGTLVGVPTGSGWGISILDVDPRNGGDKWLVSFASFLPLTQTHYTRSGGYHFLFKHSHGMRCSNGQIAPGIDIKADGGYIIWWPAKNLPISNLNIIAEWPQWLLDKLLPPPSKPMTSISTKQHSSLYIQRTLEHAIVSIMNAPEGERNDTLYKKGYSLYRFVLTGELNAKEFAITLSLAALTAGLDRREIISTVTSILNGRRFSHG